MKKTRLSSLGIVEFGEDVRQQNFFPIFTFKIPLLGL